MPEHSLPISEIELGKAVRKGKHVQTRSSLDKSLGSATLGTLGGVVFETRRTRLPGQDGELAIRNPACRDGVVIIAILTRRLCHGHSYSDYAELYIDGPQPIHGHHRTSPRTRLSLHP